MPLIHATTQASRTTLEASRGYLRAGRVGACAMGVSFDRIAAGLRNPQTKWRQPGS